MIERKVIDVWSGFAEKFISLWTLSYDITVDETFPLAALDLIVLFKGIFDPMPHSNRVAA
jgi:hypothetical protein